MNIFAALLSFSKGFQSTTVTLEDIERQVDEDARLKDAQERAQAIIAQGYGYIPAPVGAVVIDNTTSAADQARNAGMLVVGETIYDANGYVPAAEWQRLNADGDQYLATLEPMHQDQVTGRPTVEAGAE